MDGNWLFHILNNLEFGGKYSAEEIRNEICVFNNKDAFILESLRRWFWYSYKKH